MVPPMDPRPGRCGEDAGIGTGRWLGDGDVATCAGKADRSDLWRARRMISATATAAIAMTTIPRTSVLGGCIPGRHGLGGKFAAPAVTGGPFTMTLPLALDFPGAAKNR